MSAFVPPSPPFLHEEYQRQWRSDDPSGDSWAVLVAGVTSVYHYSHAVENNRVPTVLPIGTFIGVSHSYDIKVWRLIYRAEPLSPWPLQCHSCWRFSHTSKARKSSPRCQACGGSHWFCRGVLHTGCQMSMRGGPWSRLLELPCQGSRSPVTGSYESTPLLTLRGCHFT